MNDQELAALADASSGDFQRRTRLMEDFRYDEQQEKYWDTTTGNLLAAKSVDGAIPPAEWPTREDSRTGDEKPLSPARAINNVDTGLTVEGSTWWPGLPRFIQNVVVSERGAMELTGAVCYNSYIEPQRKQPSKKSMPKPWLDHVKKLYPDPIEHEHFLDFCAHMLQRPDEKIQHGIVMAGTQGIGKDTALFPLRRGVGEWNAAEVGPDAITSPYNGHVRSVLLVINEVRPHDEEYKASNFYNMLKPLLASPPEMLPMTLKYANTIYIRNLCHIILTTNDPLTMYIPPEDRRLFVMTSALEDPKEHQVFSAGYFDVLYDWLKKGGCDIVIDWLLKRDISELNPNTPPPMTSGKKAIIGSANQVRRCEIDEIFEAFCEELYEGKKPDILFHRDLSWFITQCGLFDDQEKFVSRLNAKNFHFKMADRGYDLMRNPYGREWRNGSYRSRMAFIKRSVAEADRLQYVTLELEKRPLTMRKD